MSHFSIGRADADMTNPKPVQPVEPCFQIGDLNIEEQRKRLTQASWTSGQSPIKYQSIQMASYHSPQGANYDDTKRDFYQTKARISASSVMSP